MHIIIVNGLYRLVELSVSGCLVFVAFPFGENRS